MTSKTLTRADLSEAVHHEVGLSRNESASLVDTVLEEICGVLATGELVKISAFGTFKLREKRERVGRNPKTGKEATITSRRVLVFRPSQILQAKINAKPGTRS